MADVGKWCLGHGVIGQAESLRVGHYVEAYLVDANFTPHKSGSKGFATSFPRCNHCRSIRRWHDHHANALRRARRFRREHAQRWVDLGRANTAEEVLMEMLIGGVTDEAVADIIIASIGEDCLGFCAYEENGQIIRHKINRVSELHVDVRDPDEPITLENIGILCTSCNPSKGDDSYTLFTYRRRAEHLAWQAAIDNPQFRGSEQMGIPGI